MARNMANYPARSKEVLGSCSRAAATEVAKAGIKVQPEVMVPLVGFKRGLDLQAELVQAAVKEVMVQRHAKLNDRVGTMIEVPRGALSADEIAQTAVPHQAGSASGTDDLNQTRPGQGP